MFDLPEPGGDDAGATEFEANREWQLDAVHLTVVLEVDLGGDPDL